MLTQEKLKSLVEYDPLTGVFLKNGETTGTISKTGYKVISVENSRYYAHRLAWLYVFGCLPRNMIDHINRDKLDNRISNLRDADRSLNSSNTPVRSHSQVGHKHIKFDKRDNRYSVVISRKGVYHYFGRALSLEDALAIREKAYATFGGR
jgi:hypothetical protein